MPSVADLQRDIAASSAEVDEAAKEDLALPPVAPFAPGPGLTIFFLKSSKLVVNSACTLANISVF